MTKTKMISSIFRFYIECCISTLIIAWVSTKFTLDSFVMGASTLYIIFIWAPIYTLLIGLVNFLKINTKILGNIYNEITVIFLPYLLNICYFYVAYNLTDNSFETSSNGEVISRKWFLDYGNVDIIIYSIVFILICIHGRNWGRLLNYRDSSSSSTRRGTP